MAKAKKVKRVVADQAYFELLERKAALLDQMFGSDDGLTVNAEHFKEWVRIEKAWEKINHDSDAGPYVEPYEEPPKT